MSSDKIILVLTALALMAWPGAHSATSLPIGDTFANVVVASCSKFESLGKPEQKGASKSATVSAGSAKLIAQLEGNCTGSYASYLELDLTFDKAASVMGYNASVHTGTCQAGGSLYRVDPTGPRKAGNILRIAEINAMKDGSTGVLTTGAFGVVRAKGGSDIAKSVRIFNAKGSPISCCDLTATATSSESEIKADLGRGAKPCPKVDKNTPGVMVNGKWQACVKRLFNGYVQDAASGKFCTLLRDGTKVTTLADGSDIPTSTTTTGPASAPPSRIDGTMTGNTTLNSSSTSGGSTTVLGTNSGTNGTASGSKNGTKNAAAAVHGGSSSVLAAVTGLLVATAGALVL